MIRHLLSKPVDFYLHIILHIPADASLFVVSNYIVLCSFNVQYIQNTVLVILFLFANFILFLLLEGIVIYSITEDIHKIMLLLLVVLNLFFHYIFIPVAFL
ncbi:hypothetical protein HMPREF0982_00825 [Erysipelotrichaceae bacterium 21_3]|nr:hypothetical protein HMPREF0982_00825 [Erysipelotrichaceae bacterium 21_3]